MDGDQTGQSRWAQSGGPRGAWFLRRRKEGHGVRQCSFRIYADERRLAARSTQACRQEGWMMCFWKWGWKNEVN